MAYPTKTEAAMGKPAFTKNGVQIFFQLVEPKTTRGKRRIQVAIRIPKRQWRNHHLLQYPFGLDVQYVNVESDSERVDNLAAVEAELRASQRRWAKAESAAN